MFSIHDMFLVFLFLKNIRFVLVGPFKINGVPLRRVNQSYVIATSTKVDIAGVNVDKFDDKYFSKQVDKKKKKGEGEFFETEKEVCHFFFIISFSIFFFATIFFNFLSN